MSRPDVDFLTLLEQSGVPTTEAGMEAALKTEAEAAGSLISNDSTMSPFWRLVKAVVIAPALWLVRTLLAAHILPATYAATATDAYLDLKAWDVGLTRKPAVKTRGMITFTKTDPGAAVTVPAGTVISTERIDGVTYRLLTLEETTIAGGEASGQLLAEAEEAGDAWNLPQGYYSILPVEVAGISQASNEADWITQTGAEEEDSDSLALRIRNQFSAVGTHHIDAVYRAMLADVAGIRTDNIFFEHDAPRGPGTANAYILLDVGQTPQSLVDQLNDHVMTQGNHGHGDDLQCFVMPDSQVDLTVTLSPVSNLTDSQLQALTTNVEQRIRAAFRETASYPAITRAAPNSRFSFSRLAGELHRQLPNLQSVAFDRGDILSGLSMPRIQMINMEVE